VFYYRYLAIDETDRMLEKGHFKELHSLLEMLNVDESKKRRRQNFVFSATLTMVHEPPRRLKKQNKKLRLTPGQKLQNIMTMLGVTNPKVVDVTKESGEFIFYLFPKILFVYFVYGVFHGIMYIECL
jgi:ATP-dependent RNA helicase DDX24/MAK5